VLAVALDDGDELAAALEHLRQLGEQLREQQALERSVRREAADARRRLDPEMQRLARLEAANDDLRSRIADLERERADLREQLADLADENRGLRQQIEITPTASPTAIDPPVPKSSNRAQRRRAAKEARRKQ
jgi:predicted RNase H-like nuclease (RuvC/YqgF family)